MSAPDWQSTFVDALGDSQATFTVILDDMQGTGVYDKVMTSVARNAAGYGGATDWELSQLYQSGRLGEIAFIEDGALQANPF
jgi:hypothetical protein